MFFSGIHSGVWGGGAGSIVFPIVECVANWISEKCLCVAGLCSFQSERNGGVPKTEALIDE